MLWFIGAENLILYNKKVIVVGMSLSFLGGDVFTRLQQLKVPILNSVNCAHSFYTGQPGITARMMCAGFQGTGGKDSCHVGIGNSYVSVSKGLCIVGWGNSGMLFPDY